MKKEKTIINFVFLLTAGLLIGGCSSAKRIQSGQLPAGTVENQASTQKAMPPAGYYIVQKHDTLWAIADKPAVYGDPFEWPPIFKANRDKVADPDLIYPRQSFRIEKGLDKVELGQAKQLAMETPKYVPHATPRQTLPVDYF
jgi:hypothetical protein